MKEKFYLKLFKMRRHLKYLFTVGLICGIPICVFSQVFKLTMHKRNVSIENVLREVEKQSHYTLFYNNNQVNLSKKISVNLTDASLGEALRTVFQNTGYTYRIVNDQIVVYPLTVRNLSASANTQQSNRITVSGYVKDVKGEPIIGASVVEKGISSNGVITDINGRYTLKVNVNSELQFSYIGYAPKTIKVREGITNYNIVLKEETTSLNEVVVVGYGTVKKKDLVGAVSSVKMSDVPVSTISTISHALAGAAAGFQVSTISAQPGGESTFQIRGAASSLAGNNPLIIIDGFPINSDISTNSGGSYYSEGSKDNLLSSLNPNDIESIDVLKDASSTAIYGSRAGNGVIIITTKKGKKGIPKVEYSNSVSIQSIARNYEMLNATDFMKVSNMYTRDIWLYNNGIGIYGGKTEDEASSPYVPKYTDDEIANPSNNTNWIGAVTRQGFQTQHNISISGGSDYSKYLVSGNFFQQNGVLKNNDMSRYTLRANIDQILSKYVKTGLSLTAARSTYNNVPLGNRLNEYAGLLVSASQFNPLIPIRDEKGNYSYNTSAAFLPNPVSLLEITDKTIKDRLLGSAYIDIEPIKNLHIKSDVGIDRNYQKRSTYLPTTTLYGAKMNGEATIGQQDNNDYLADIILSYSKKIGAHQLSAMLGSSYQTFHYESLTAGNNDFITDSYLYDNLNAGNADKPTVGSAFTISKIASYFARLNYNYKDKYLLTVNFRADGSSNFASGHRWGYFPSLAVGWRFSEENFMRKLSNILSNGKLRLSWGETGNSDVGDVSHTYYGVGGADMVFGTTTYKGVYVSQLGNPDLTWETDKEWNLGLDLSFFNSRLNITSEAYYKLYSNLLATKSIMSYNEISWLVANTGETQSKGFELTVNTMNIRTKEFSWSTDFTYSSYRDKWKKRADSWIPSSYSIYHAPVRASYGYVSDGLVKPGETISYLPGAIPGQVKIKDINGFVYNSDGSIKTDKHGIPLKTGKPDGKIDEADEILYGTTDPGCNVGLNNSFRWKNFDFNIYFYGQFNVLNGGSYKSGWLGQAPNLARGYNLPTSAFKMWSSQNTNGTYPGFFESYSPYGEGDYFNKKIWWVRCRNISLGYTMPKSLIKNMASNVHIYVDINNPFILTSYDGLDPETDKSGGYSYPNVRTYSVGLNVTF